MCLLNLATSGYILSEIWPHSFLKSGNNATNQML